MQKQAERNLCFDELFDACLFRVVVFLVVFSFVSSIDVLLFSTAEKQANPNATPPEK
jgi:hypothetical protein